MKRKELLATAEKCVCGQREHDYGTPEDNFRTIANLWAAYLLSRSEPFDILPEDVAAMMALVKVARLSTNPKHTDSWVDLAGYAACGAEIATEKRAPACDHNWVMIPKQIQGDFGVAPYICEHCGESSWEE